MRNKEKEITPSQREDLIAQLSARFERDKSRHRDLEWSAVEKKLLANPVKLWSLHEMEISGGEPALVAYDEDTDEYLFYDCSADSPKGRRSVCYDYEAQESRKEHKPANNAIDLAASMGIELLNEDQYRKLQQFGKFDLKTSSWIKTPAEIRELDGALFCDRRYNQVFVYHNGAQSYYAARGFRGLLRL